MSPTGYTAKLYEGEDQSFPEFAMSCARAFGALVTMRDEPADAPIPDEFEPSSYHVDALARAEERLAEVKSWSDEQAAGDLLATRTLAAKTRADLAADSEAKVARYEAMLTEVERWEPPTSEHVGLRDFMLDQLRESINFDRYKGGYPTDPEATTGPEWRDDQIAKAVRDIEYHTEELEKERERAKGRTAWVRDLRESLAVEVTR